MVLKMFPEPTITYRYLAELINPSEVAEAIERHFGEALADRDTSSEAVRVARDFLREHQEQVGKLSAEP